MSITEEQRLARRKYLGSSDSPIIMNLSPYSKTAADIYWSKVADAQEELSGSWIDTGNWLEGPLIQWAADELGVDVTVHPQDLFCVAHEGDGAEIFAANHDSLIIGQEASIEAKFANGEMAQAYGEPGTDQVADHVIIQVQHQMYVSDLEKVYVPLAVPSYYGVDRRLYLVPRDDELIEQIVTFGCRWWTEHVECKLPPDESDVPPLYVLKALERRAGAQIKLDDKYIALADDDDRLKGEIKALKTERESVRRDLIHGLGDAEIGLLSDGRKVTYQGHEVSQFMLDAFRSKHPELGAKFTERKTQRTLYMKKGQ